MLAKTIRLFPLTFIAGQHGLVIFVPYVLMAFTTLQLLALQRRRSDKKSLIPIPVSV